MINKWLVFALSTLVTIAAAVLTVVTFGRALWVSQDSVTSTILGRPWKQVRFDDLRQVRVKSRMGSPDVVLDLISPESRGAMGRWRINGANWVSITPLMQRLGFELQRGPDLLATPEDANNWRLAFYRM